MCLGLDLCKEGKLKYLCFCCIDSVQFIYVFLPQEQCGSRDASASRSVHGFRLQHPQKVLDGLL